MRSADKARAFRILLVLAGGLLLPAAADAQPVAADASTATLGVAQTRRTTEPIQGHARSGQPPRVFVIPVQGEFEAALHLVLVRALRQAQQQEAGAVVLDMDSPGGRVDAAIKIRDALIECPIPTYTYVNPMAISAGSFIAIATDTIVMGPNSSIGGALPITMGPEGAQSAGEKFISIFNAEMRKTAKTKGHPVDIAEGFCNPNKVIPGLKEKGEILTLDFEQATSVGLAEFQAGSLEAMLEHEGLGSARVTRFKLTLLDQVARFLSSSAIMGLLMMIGLGGLFIEIKSPGVGIPGLIGVMAIVLYFFGSYLANLSSYLEWVVFVIGVFLVFAEIYLIPGFGVAGIAGGLMIFGSLFFALYNLAPDGSLSFNAVRLQMLIGPLLTILVVMVAMVPFVLVLAKALHTSGALSSLILEPEAEQASPPPVMSPSEPERAGLAGLHPGATGQALTDLRPAGTALIEGHRVDVLTEGEHLLRGDAVEVTRVEGSRIFVQLKGESSG